MSPELFRQIINNAWLGTALFAIAVALWMLVFRFWDEKPLSFKSSKAATH